MRKKRVIVWFRQDLRLHDNEALQEALSHSHEVIPVYVFDERTFAGKTIFGFPKTGSIRARFIIDAVACLRRKLQELGSDLIVRVGKPEDEIFQIANSTKTSWVFCNRERTHEEVKVQDALEKQLWSIGQEVRFSRGKMLYYTADLPFPVTHTPDHFATFRKETERIVGIRKPIETPGELPPLNVDLERGEVPSPVDFGLESNSKPLVFSGGEDQALECLEEIAEHGASKVTDGLSALSPWLSQGCLSPKMLHCAVPRISNKDRALGEAVIHGLLYRDYLRLMAKKYGNAVFTPGGVTGKAPPVSESDRDLFWLWAKGKTGLPFIDAAMRQLNETGYMPFKARMLTAHFLIEEFGVAWRLGASYFESHLIDYDPCSNWVNWCNIAGIGPDSREERKINYILQARRLDPDGSYVKRWIPALREADHHWLHQPDQASEEQLTASAITLGKDYPKAVLSSDRWNALS